MDLKKKIRNFCTLSHRENGGFTLVELIVVIAILAILAGVAVPAYSGYIKKAEQAADEQLLAALNTAYATACMENGEYDMKGITSFSPSAQINEAGAVTVNAECNDAFQQYFGNGVFKHYDFLGFVASEGVFKGNTVAELIQILQGSWNGSSFGSAADGGEAVMGELSAAFDQIGNYFSGNNDKFPGGFSLDGMLATAPADVVEKFGFGTFDMTDEQILEKYIDGYADMSDAEKAEYKATLTTEKMNTIRGNAYVMRFAEDAAGRTAETITNDVKSLMGALSATVYEEDVIDYYNKLNPDNPATNYNEAKEALELMGGAVPAEMIVAIGNSDAKNTSGVSTLGSMYALAAGFYNSGLTNNKAPGSFTDFSTVMAAMSDPKFGEYLNGKDGQPGQAQKDIGAYLDYMNYVSTGNVDMDSADAFASLGGDIWESIGGNK